MTKRMSYNQLAIYIYMVAAIKNISILPGRGYFLSDKSDKKYLVRDLSLKPYP